ncbi:MAG: MBL fold metallo-hydrolase [Candidatus Scalindua sp.]|nr:MBL fold metallo-hydrolase [Candidatus Scalindua sp.]
MSGKMYIRFWGVRGSIATPGKGTVKYGGNTSCIEVRCGDEILILDAGTGIRELGSKLLKEEPRHINILFSHFHYDHIEGFPFFGPIFNKDYSITLIGRSKLDGTLEQLFATQLMFPYFPRTLKELDANIGFHEVNKKNSFRVGDITIKLCHLRHPGDCLAYRIEYRGNSVVYATDTEHSDRIDLALLHLASCADVLVYDCNFTDEEYSGIVGAPKVGWGHSTWSQGVKMARAAKVKKLILFHHDPSHDDWCIDRLESKAQKGFRGAYAAFEGMEIAF